MRRVDPARRKLIDCPRSATVQDYKRAVEQVAQRIEIQSGFVALYQIGHVSNPGISDIDLIAVFEDGALSKDDGRSGLSSISQYLFAHELWGASRTDFTKALGFTLFHNYKLISGEDTTHLRAQHSDAHLRILKRQVALEYLLRIYINLAVERTYGIVKVRNLLLHAKALLFDCEYLGLDGAFREAVEKIVNWRTHWLNDPPAAAQVAQAVTTLEEQLENALAVSLDEGTIYFPARDDYRLSRSIQLAKGSNLNWSKCGICLPAWLSILGKRIVKVQNRLNSFIFQVPFSSENLPEIIREKFLFEAAHRAYNQRQLPAFMPMATSMNFV